MTDEPTTEVAPQVDSFANHVIGDWNDAMERFFSAVDRKRAARDLTDAEARDALRRGYGEDIAEAWDEWSDDE